jgi:hypothetical protein
MITLWGPSRSGKTALLAYLILKLPPAESGWEIFPTAESREEVRRRIKQILKENEFPLGTKEAEAERISCILRDTKTGTQFPLDTTDQAGILSERMDSALLQSLAECQGIVLLLDWNRGLRETEIIEALLEIHFKRSESGKSAIGERDERPLAVCLSKVDQFIRNAEDLRRLQDDPDGFVEERLSIELRRRIQQFHNNVRFFPVSSVGLRLHHGCIQKSVFYDEKLLLRVTNQGTPMNIVEPFIWIFEQLRAVA